MSVRRVAVTGIVLGIAGVGVIATPARAKEASFSSKMTTAEEVPDKGPEGATGTATVSINTDTNQVCYKLSTAGLTEAPTLGHIHEGAAGVAGPVVIDFNVAANGLDKCVAGDAAKVAAVIANPAGFYVNLHTATHPKGALRGQLSAASTTTEAATTALATTGSRTPALLAAFGLVVLVLGGLARQVRPVKPN